MRKRYVVAPDQVFIYPADRESLNIITFAGGLSKLSPEDKKRVRMKTVADGDDCSDMPEGSLQVYLQRGLVVEVNEPELRLEDKEPLEETQDE